MHVVTGGTGALGRAVVELLLARNQECVVPWVHEAELESFPFGQRVRLERVDLTDESAVERLYGSVDNLEASIHTAGGFAMSPITETAAAEVERLFRLNALTSFLCSREAVRGFRRRGRGGRIVNVSARPAMLPTGGMIAYSMSKAAVANLTRSLAQEVRSDGILVNAVVPSVMDTPANRRAMPEADFDEWPKVEEVARIIAFLAGSDNELGSGAVMPVYGRA